MTTQFRKAVRSLLREQILDAAYAQVAADGWGRIGIAGIARAAGVSRQTVYNEFGTKEAIGLALVEREAERFLLGIAQEIDQHRDSLERAASAGVAYVLRTAQDNPLVKSVITSARGGDEDLLLYLTTRHEPVFDTAIAMLDAYSRDAWPEADDESRSLAVETIVRLTVSHIVQPLGSPDEAASRIARITVRVAFPDGEPEHVRG